MKDLFKRCLALVMVLSLVLGTGVASALAASVRSDDVVITANVEDAIIADPFGQHDLMQDVLDDMTTQLSGYDAESQVTFIVELEGSALLDAKPTTQTPQQYMTSAVGVAAATRICVQQATVLSRIQRVGGSQLTLDYTYQVVLNGFAVTGPYSLKAQLEAVPGVASVTVAQTYQYEEPVAGYTALQTSGSMIDSDSANAAGYTGKGTVTAIVDTGLDITHSAFANAPEEPALDQDDISAAVASGNLNASATAEDLYKSAKIPFAYDYTANSAVMSDPISHGTHVAGTVGADCDAFSGVAPDTQLVILKVFDSQGSGATDAVIFAALEDAVVLGVDTINMSLGTPCGFTSEDTVTDAVYNKIKSAGISLMVSAGNETDATSNTNLGTNLPLVSEPDNAIVGSPSTYPAALSVASVNEYAEYSTYLLSGDLHLAYTDANVDTSMDFVATFNGQTLDYVYVPGFGTADDFAAVDVSGKLALVARGELAFTEKETNAYNAGAVGMIVFDNAEGDLINMQGNGLIPMIFISKANGLTLRDQETRTLSVSSEYQEFTETSDGGLMSSFSSLGVAPDLTLKPEITAPGGYVYSTLPGNTYGSMSGTSMASPHMAGAASVVRQYVNAAFPDASDTDKQNLINTLLMNTAIPVEDEYGIAYTPRKQGSGLAQVNSAINTGAYVTVEGSGLPKAELGDSANGYFSKEVTLTIHNITDADLTYAMSSIALTAMEETVNVNGIKYNCISNHARVMPESEFQVLFSEDTVTVPANGTAAVSVKLRLTEEGEAALANFVNGTFLDGFIVLEDAAEGGIDLSVPYVGFYGDWGQASVFDDSIYDEEEASVFASSVSLFDLSSGNGYYLGANLFTDDLVVDKNKIAVSREMLSSGYRPFTMMGLLRAPESLTYTITDSNGELVEFLDELTLNSLGYEYTVENVIKSFYYSTGGYINYEMGPTYYGWMPAQDFGDGFYGWLDDGSYTIHITAQVAGTDSEAGTQNVSFPITLDSVAPQLLGTDFEEVDGVPYVTLDLYDNQYVMAFQVLSVDGLTAFSPVIPVDEEEAGTISSFTFDTSALLEAGYTTAVVVAYDYALNAYASYEFSLESDTLQPASVTLNNKPLSVSGAQSFEVEAYVEPEGLEDTVLTWTSSDESIATIVDTGRTRYDSDAGVTLYIAEVTTYNVGGDVTIAVSTQNGKTDACTFRVVADYDDLPSDYVIREDGTYLLPADLNTKVTITDNARNVTIVGNSSNTKDSPYQNLYLYSEVSELNLTVRNLNVTTTGNSANPVISFTGSGNQLILSGDNNFRASTSGNNPLIQAGGPHYTNNNTTTELSIDGSGSLYLYAAGYGAGIGGASGQAAGTLTIDGGNIDIDVVGNGAGIGGGSGGASGSITINGGNINVETIPANSYSYTGAGIGSGSYAYSGNTITINGGTITGYTASKAALIGAGDGDTSATTIIINGGYLNVASKTLGYTDTNGGAAIGSAGGSWSATGAANITINGGEIIAVTETAAAAIGGGYYGGVPTITVNGGTVSAIANSAYTSQDYHGPAIGKGVNGSAGYVYINAGAVLAVGNAAANLNASGILNTNYDYLTEVTLTIPGIRGLMIDGVDWKVSANHADFTGKNGTDYSEEVHVWLPESTTTPYIVTAETETGTVQFELYTNGNTYEFHSVSYDLTGLTTDGPAKVYDPSAGGVCEDLTGTLKLTDSTTTELPKTISVTVDGANVDAAYDAATGSYTVAKELLTGDVVITAAASEVVDKTDLNALIAQVEAMDGTLYTGTTWSALQTALAEAKDAAAAEPTTQAAVDTAYNALLTAVNALAARADISALEALIAEGDKKAESQYVSTTWTAFAEALAQAKAAAANTDATQEEVDAAAEALQAALDALIQRGNKTELRALINEADVLFESNYTLESWTDSQIEAALENAIAVYTDSDATQDEVDLAAEALRLALDKLLERSDFSALLAMIKKAKALNGDDYTADTWAALETALTAGETIANDLNALQTDIDAATVALEQAIADLKLRGNTTALEQAIAEAEALNEEYYTPETWAELEKALEEAKETVQDPNATQEDVDADEQALRDAMNALQERADTTELEALIAEAEALTGDDYTPATWTGLTTALEAAKTVLADLNASQEEVDSAAAALRNALKGLIPKANKDALAAAYQVCKALIKTAYTDVTWKALEAAVSAAADVLADPNETQAEVDAALEALLAAADGLKPTVNGAVCDGGVGCPSAKFTDVDADDWYHKDVDYMVENGYILGMTDTLFGASQSLNRAQLVTILYRIAGEPSVEGLSHPFTDVEDGRFYTDAVIWAYNEGIVNGQTATAFDPNGTATREQFAAILYRMSGSPEASEDPLSQFTDGDQVSNYAEAAMNWAISNGLINGSKEAEGIVLMPKGNTTRAQAAAILHRFLTH